MREDASPAEVRAEERLAEQTILHLLLSDDWPGLWSTEELAQALGDPLQAADGLAALHGAGLVHINDGYVWATRAAAHAHELSDAV